jgi:hypothetical protein
MTDGNGNKVLLRSRDGRMLAGVARESPATSVSMRPWSG